MGLFGNSETQNKKDAILRDITVINKALRDIGSLLDKGMNVSSVNSCSSIIENMESNINRVSTTIQGMSDSELSGFTVPWMDGRYLGIMMWITTFQMVMNKTINEMEKVH